MLRFQPRMVCAIASLIGATTWSLVHADDHAAIQTEHPVVTEVRQQLGDRSPDKPFVMAVELVAKEGQGKAIIAAMKDAHGPTREEDANVRYQLLGDPADPNRFQIAEQWKNLDGLATHLRQPYIQTLLKRLEEVLAQPPGVKVLTPIWMKK